MNRAFTTREKVLILIFAVLLLGICYFKLLLEPINDSVDECETNTEIEQNLITQNTAKLTKMRSMETELEEIKAAGEVKPLPTYDNSEKMLTDLNSILSAASDYSLNFASSYALTDTPYIMARPVELIFYAQNYTTARSIIDALHDSANVNQIYDVAINVNDDDSVNVTLSIVYYELQEKTDTQSGSAASGSSSTKN